MSNHLAIATVTAALERQLANALSSHFPGVTVSNERPGTSPSAHPAGAWRVNVYLWQVRPNPSLRNVEAPVRRADGSLAQVPLLPLDLHYLVSFYGDDGKYEPQRAMGVVATSLHTYAMLDRSFISATIAGEPDLAGSDLDQQPVGLRITPANLDLEEVFKLWSVVFDTGYVPSIPYVVSAVLLEPALVARTALPVGGHDSVVGPFTRPLVQRIDKLQTDADPSQGILTTSTILLRGSGLAAEGAQVRLGPVLLTPDPADVSDSLIRLDLSAQAGLQAGVLSVQVVHPLAGLGTGSESPAVPLVLRPGLESADIRVDSISIDSGRVATVTLELDLPVSVGPDQRVVVLLNQRTADPDDPQEMAAAVVPPGDSPTSTIQASFGDLATGTWLVRVSIDGAESLLTRDPPGVGETVGRFGSPSVELEAP